MSECVGKSASGEIMRPTKESLYHMFYMKDFLVDIQRDHPEVQGFGFLGSRAIGQEGDNSDLDTVVFVSSDGIIPDSEFEYQDKEGNALPGIKEKIENLRRGEREYKELTGKPIDLKIILLIFSFSLIQSFKNTIVFSFSLIGLLVIVIYLYIVQES